MITQAMLPFLTLLNPLISKMDGGFPGIITRMDPVATASLIYGMQLLLTSPGILIRLTIRRI
jgi:hypothetical protein